ncbi:MAG: hypothetical protein R6U85_08765 [Salinivirgaceae bacterium]
MLKKGILFILIGFSTCRAMAQQETDNVKFPDYQRLSVGYIFGGQIYNETFSYTPGIDIKGTYGIRLSKRVGAGLGIGYYQLPHERFIPIGLEVSGNTDKGENTAVLSMQLGYAHGWYKGNNNIVGFDFQGGLHFAIEYTMQRKINEALSVQFNVAYRHQFAKMEFETYTSTNYSQMANYDMLVLSLGLSRNAH